MNLSPSPISASPAARWWREWEVWAIALLGIAIYVPRIADLSLRGEETRRAGIAIEMIRTGDWIVPRLQNSPVFFRPPLQNWAIGVAGLMRGEVDAVAIRWPSVASVILLGMLVYVYSRTCVGRLGAFAAGAAFITLGQVLELGSLGETDPLFMSLLGGSLLIWHYGRVRGWPPVWFWIAGYSLAALATLAKGVQGPVYFAVSIGLFLLWTGHWRDALRWPHLLGILVFAAVLATWHVPYYRALGWAGLRRIYWDDVGQHLTESHWGPIVRHLVSYPLEILGCLLPWSILLVAYLSRGFRETLKPIREHVVFLVGSIAITFPSCWLALGGRSRYFMPLYPCFAVLIGIVVQHCCNAPPSQKWHKLWPRFLAVVSGLMIAAAIAAVLWQPAWFTLVYALATAALATTTWQSSRCPSTRSVRGILAVAAFMGLTSTGIAMNYTITASEPNAANVAELKRRLPPDVHLVSLGTIDHLFAYYYRDPIGLLPRTAEGEQAIAPGDYFCSGADNAPPMKVSFPYEKIAEVSCDRQRANRGQRVVLVGRRLPVSPTKPAAKSSGGTNTKPH